jgi:hypothetical protein
MASRRMKRSDSRAVGITALFLALVGAMLSSCGGADLFGGPGPFVREGNADSVEIGFTGDISNAMPLARKHCAQFERVPRYAMGAQDGAVFDCVRPGS